MTRIRAEQITSGAATDGQVLTADGSGNAAWETQSGGAAALDDLTDVTITSPANGATLEYDSGTQQWIDYALGLGLQVVNTGSVLQLGNVSGGNYVQIDLTSGTLTLVGEATAWDDVRVSGNSTRPGATAPTLSSFGPSGNLRALTFANTRDEEVFFEIQMPHSWKEGTDLHPHIHWSPTTTGSGNVVWELEYAWANIDGTFGAPSTMSTGAVAAGGTAWAHKMSDFLSGGSEVISGTGKTFSSMLICRLHRNGGAGSDTYAAGAALLEFDIHYQINSFGSDLELVKDTTGLLTDGTDYLLDNDGQYLS